MEKIGLFGGTFNPIHNGHILCPKSLVEQGVVDGVIFIPSRIPPLKDAKKLAGELFRWEMVNSAIEGYPFFSASDIELKREGVSYTIDTVKELVARHRGAACEFHLIMGSDWIKDFHRWKDCEELARLVSFIVMKREKSRVEIKNPSLSREIKIRMKKGIVEVPYVPVSSSLIRERINDDAYLRESVPEPVYRIIRENRLYI